MTIKVMTTMIVKMTDQGTMKDHLKYNNKGQFKNMYSNNNSCNNIKDKGK